MSQMTQSLLLEAQSLRLEGELDASVDLLRVVLSQCDSDLRGLEVQHRVAVDGNSDDHAGLRCQQIIKTTRQVRRMGSYQMALLLLQRSGRQTHGIETSKRDVHEADQLLWKLGFRMRLSNRALGYPLRGRRRNDETKHQQPSPRRASVSKLPLTVIDNLLHHSIFNSVKQAFKSESRYWSDIYCKASENNTREQQVEGQKRTNQFVSHNITLASIHTLPSKSLLCSLQHSTSLLEQVANIVRHRLKTKFPEIINATSVEVWSHRRPPDGQHQLHYDLDEVLLWKHRNRDGKGKEARNDTTGIIWGNRTKRQKTACNETTKKIRTEETQHQQELVKGNGVSCPIVSCVLTINAGCTGNNGAPTIVCNQSILERKGNKSNVGFLCYPIPNRLLAFEGSLLHGVVPGIPGLQHSSTSSDADESDRVLSDSFYDLDVHEATTPGVCGTDHDQRITLMLGFWRDVCLSTPETTEHSSLVDIGPNVTFGRSIPKNSWKEEFRPVSITESQMIDMAMTNTGANESTDVDIIDPLWVRICNETLDETFLDTPADSEGLQCSGRFFLKSLESTDIDHKVMYGAWPKSENRQND